VVQNDKANAAILGFFILLGLSSLGYLLGAAAIEFKEYERTVTVKGLAEREYPADKMIWPIQFSAAHDDLEGVYIAIESSAAKITAFLEAKDVQTSEMTSSSPIVTDKTAQRYGNAGPPKFRYAATQTITVYSTNIDVVRSVMNDLSQLGKQGIAFVGGDYQSRTEYIFTRLNEIKPEMIEEATTKAREVALKFAEDSKSQLGKIKRALQGQFSISSRDRNTPHIKRIRVVSTVEYYLSD